VGRGAGLADDGDAVVVVTDVQAYTVLRLIAECGDDMSKWPTAKHFTSWLSFAPGNKISGGRLLSSKTRRSANRAAALLRIAAVNIGRTQTALGPSTAASQPERARPRP
jgi:transposase